MLGGGESRLQSKARARKAAGGPDFTYQRR